MKILLWGLFAFATLAHAQGTVTDIDGNTYDYLTYGTQQWTVVNAAMETYRDGTPIPQVTDATQWSNLTTGAWCYYDNDPTKGKLYNWYAVAGIHDNDPNTPNKEFAPLGWHVPTDTEWTTLKEYLIANGYNYDGTTTGNKIGKSMASISGWNSFTNTGAVGNDQSTNNSSGFNAFPEGSRSYSGYFILEGNIAFLWSSTQYNASTVWFRDLYFDGSDLYRSTNYKRSGFSVRFVQNSNTCSEASINASATEVCAGESVDLNVNIIGSNFSNWNTNEPNNNNGNEHVGMLVENAKWNDHRASNSSPDFLMESDTDLGVLSGFNFLGAFEGHFYYQSTTNSTWTNANSTATSLGGYLLILNSQAENDFIAQTSNITVHGSWIGMYQDTNHPDYSEPGGAWFWGDGTSVTMSSNPPTYTWSTGDTTANISVTPTETTEYWVDVTNNGVTCREYVTINVTAPVAPTGDSEQTFCDMSTVADLTATGENIQWYDAATDGNLLDPTAALTDGQMVYASQTVNGCESTERLEVSVSIQDITITASATEVCTGESVDLTVSSGLTAGSTACTSADLPANLQTGLVGYWPFCGNANDESGNGNNGTVNGANLNTDRFGNPDSAYSFNGDNSYINNPTQLLEIGSNYSVSFWFSSTDVNQGNQGPYASQALFNSIGDTGIGIAFNHVYNPGVISLFIGDGLNFWDVNGSAGMKSDFNNNQWYNVTLVKNGINYKMYVDGILDIDINVNSSINYTSSVGFTIGTGSEGVNEPLFGSNDDLIIWNRALSETEIQQLANSSTYSWSTGDTTETISVTPTETTEYWVDVTTNGVTCREYITINVTAPAAPTGDAQQTFCEASTLADLAATGDNIQWYDSATGGNLLDSTTALADGQMVYASQTVNGCESTDRLEVTVLIQDITITASATEVCAGDSVDLTVSSGLTAGTTACTSADLPANLQTGLVGYWPFCGNANDESGNGLDGDIYLNPILTTGYDGTEDSAYDFDWDNVTGYGTAWQRIEVPYTNQLNNSDITITAWIKPETFYWPNNSIQNSMIIGSSQACTSTNLRFSLHSDGSLNFSLNSGLGITSGPNKILLNTWQHVAVRANSNEMELFINGISQGVVSHSTNPDFDGCLVIGEHHQGNGHWYYFDGIIDNIGIWNRAISPSEIQQLVNPPTYTWSTGDTSETISVTPTETTEYWVDVTTNGVTCREYVTINVTAPAAPTGDAEQTFCDAATVADLTATGENIQWYDAATGVNLLDSTTALTDGQMVYASQTVNGCESTDRLEVTVSIQDITLTASATEVCAGESVDLTVSSGLTVGTTACTSTDLPANLQTGLVGYWPFCGNANDESGNGNNGTVNGATLTTDRFGNPDSAYSFDGVSNYIESNRTHLNTFTASVWIKLNTSNCFSAILDAYPSSWEFLSDCISGTNLSTAIWNNPTTYEIYESNYTIPQNVWINVVMSYGNNTLNIYSEGNLVFTGTTTAPPALNGLLYFGRSRSGSDSFFNGDLDDIAIWNKILTPQEVNQLYTPSISYLWSTGDTTETISVTPTETTEYWVDVTTNGVTCREYVTISVNDLPEAPTGETVNYFINCDSFSPTLNDAIATLTGDNIKLYDAAVGGNLLDPNSNILDGQVVYASQTLDSCESSERLEVQLNLYTLEMPVTAAPNNTVSFCNEQNLTILDLAPAQTATDRLWYETATSTTPIAETTPLVDGMTYYVSNYNLETGCESDRLAMTVEINNPEAPTGDAVQSFCDNVIVSDLSASASNIQWYDAATGGNVLDPSSTLSDGQVLYASQTENSCESITRLEVSVEIDIIPDPILITTELEFCLAREATLVDLEIDDQGFALEWYDSFSGGIMLPMDTLLEDGVSYYATLYDVASGCESLMRLEVVPTVIPCEVVIYNAISLNDNGINDYMVIENAEYFPDNSLEVYNRDGHLLYSQTQYGIGDNLFRGMANVSGIYGSTLSGDGPRLPTGSYLYVFKYFNPYEQQQYTLKGFLTINSN